MPRRVARTEPDGPRPPTISTSRGSPSSWTRATRAATSSRCCNAPRGNSATCRSRWSTRSRGAAACPPHASTASSRSTPSSAPSRAAATRSACATAPPATWPARRASPRRSRRSSGSPTAAPRATWSSRLDSVACMGACSQAPVMRVDEETYGNLSADQTRKVVRALIEELGLTATYGAGADGDDLSTPPRRPSRRSAASASASARPAASAASRSAPAPPACSPAR